MIKSNIFVIIINNRDINLSKSQETPNQNLLVQLAFTVTAICLTVSAIITISKKIGQTNQKRQSLKAIEDAFAFKPTDNQMGFSLPLFTALEKSLLEKLDDDKAHTLLEIGAGHGLFTLTAMAQNPNLTLHINDLSETHLTKCQEYAQQHRMQAKEIRYLPGDIFKQTLEPNYYDIVVIRHVLHFFDSEQITQLLKNIEQTLSPGGMIYIVTGSPYSNIIDKTGVLKTIEAQKTSGEQWPGFISNFKSMVAEKQPKIAEKLPQQLHVMHTETLKTALEAAGFKVEKIDYYPAPESQNAIWQQAKSMIEFDGREYTGAAACKI